MLSHVRLFATPWTVPRQAPLSMGFSRQEYWSGLPFPSPGDLPDPGIKPVSLVSPALAGRFLTTRATGEPNIMKMIWCKESENKLLLVFKSFFKSLSVF